MKTALQFSGGKDSLALLRLLRPELDTLTVYWLNTGDCVPEVRDAVYAAVADVPHFVEIQGKQPENVRDYGWPSDLVASDATRFGAEGLGHTLLIQDRGQCCFNSLMWPMHERMKADGIEVILRGQKLSDKRKSTIRHGDVVDGIKYLFPLENWSDADVFEYLKAKEVPLPPFYPELTASSDCLHCTAYLDEPRKHFLQAHHPEAWKTVEKRISIIRQTAYESLAQMTNFLEA